jgi:hypothetical protein
LAKDPPILSHIKRFARNCSRLLSTSTQRPAAGHAVADDAFTSVDPIRRAFGIVTFTRDAGVEAFCHHDHRQARVDSPCAVSVHRSGNGY